MQITRTEEYGLKGLLFMATHDPQRAALVSEISKGEKIPEAFLAKIFQRLSKAGLLRSTRGAKGGFLLRKPAHQITMREVIEALEGPIVLNRCLLRKGECEEERDCPLHSVWGEMQRSMLEILGRTTIADLAKRMIPNQRKIRR
jgi:Rrf2 family iron-sulfur cluster assembly transcriptional regulator